MLLEGELTPFVFGPLLDNDEFRKESGEVCAAVLLSGQLKILGFPAQRIGKRSDNKSFKRMYVVLPRTISVNPLENEKETSSEIETAK